MRRQVLFVTIFCVLFTFILLATQSAKGEESLLKLAQAEQQTGELLRKKKASLKSEFKPTISAYQGPTVIISGTIIYEDYKSKAGSVILVRVKSKEDINVADIARILIPQPGEYSLKVPKDFGEVYVDAVIAKRGKGNLPLRVNPDSPRGDYPNNPINVGSLDISNVNIRVLK